MSNLVSIAGRADAARREEVLKQLRLMLREAEAGNILGMIWLVERPGNCLSYGSTHIRDMYQVVAYAERMKWEAMCALDARAIPAEEGEWLPSGEGAPPGDGAPTAEGGLGAEGASGEGQDDS